MLQVDLTPPQEVKRKKTHFVVNTTARLTGFLLLTVLGVAGFFLYKSYKLKSQIANIDSSISSMEERRLSLSEIEDYSKKLAGKYFLLQRYMETRLSYSAVVKELVSRVPNSVVIDNLQFETGGKRARISGSSANSSQVSAFITELSRVGNSSSGSAVDLSGKNAFSDIRLETLSVDKKQQGAVSSSPVEYTITFKVNEEAFLK